MSRRSPGLVAALVAGLLVGIGLQQSGRAAGGWLGYPTIGTVTASGHTSAAVSVVTGPIVSTGVTLTQSGLVDPASGIPPSPGAACLFRPAGAVDFPAALVVSCVFTGPGVAAIRVVPLGGVALGTQTLTGNVFWLW